MQEETNSEIGFLRLRLEEAERKLQTALKELCAGPHNLRQHRDRQPPWCHACGRDARGNVRKQVA